MQSFSVGVSPARIKSALARGVASSFVFRVAASCAGLCMNLFLARLLPLRDFGVMVQGIACLLLVGNLSCFGAGPVATRFVAADDPAEAKGALRWGSRFSLGSGVLIAAIALLTAAFTGGYLSPAVRWAVVCVGVAVPAFAFTQTRSGALRGAKRVAKAIVLESLLRPATIIILGSLLWFLPSAGRLGWTLALLMLVQAAIAVTAWRWSRSLTYDGPEAGPAGGWTRLAAPIAVMDTLAVVSGNADTLIVGHWLGSGDAGVYRASFQLAGLVTFPVLVTNAIVPALVAELFAKRQLGDLRRVLRIAVGATSLLAVLVSLVLTLASDRVLGLFGAEFRRGGGILAVFVAGQLVNTLCGPTGNIMTMTGHQKAGMWTFGVSSIFSVLLMIALAPRFGLMGAAAASSCGLALWNVVLVVYARKRLAIDPSILTWLPGSRFAR